MPNIANGKWVKVCLLIFLNNLLLGAFVPRTLYGIIFILPYLLTVWEGLGQGVVFSKIYPKKNPLNLITFFEFGGYIFATLAGMDLGLSLLLLSQAGSTEVFILIWKDVIYIYPLVIIFLFLGSVLETFLLKKFKFPKGMKFDADKAIKEGLEIFKDRE